LTAVNQSSGNATFAYDAVGNRTTVTGAPGAGNYTANNLNQYTTAGGVGALTYDANGNLATGGGWTYTHNGNSRLVGVSGPGSVTATFGRDGRNRDVKRTINGMTIYLIYDGWNLVAEYDAAGVLTTRYIHGPQVDEILAKVTTTSTTFPLPDALGSTIAVTDGSGAVLERVYYSDAFGTPTFKDASGTTLAGTSTETRFLFTGRERLAALSLYDYRNRTYSAEFGRFIETDPIGFNAGDVNLYRYVANDPVNSIDPSGEVAVLAPAVGFIIAQLTSQLGHLISGFAQDAMSLCGKAACFEDCMSCCDRLFAVAAASKAAAVATGQASCFALIHPGAVGACLGLVTAEAISASVKLSEAGAACSASCKGKPKRKE
jgi:RHS repeat-associated protein